MRSSIFEKSYQIISLERRIPVEEVKIAFKWHDASKKGGPASVQSIAFERACTMYNLAARDDNTQC